MVVGSSMDTFMRITSLLDCGIRSDSKGDLNVLIGIFRRVGLMDNVAKFKTITFQPGKFSQGCHKRLSAGGALGMVPLTRSTCSDASHV